MSDRTKIEWASNADGSPGASWNPIRARNRATGKVGWFCTHASPGCAGCYAERMNQRLGNGVPFKAQHVGDVEIYLDEKVLMEPLRWRKPRTVFVCSMTDLFGEFVADLTIEMVFAAMALAPQHTFIVLTKRAKRMREWMTSFARQGGVLMAAQRLGADSAPVAWPLPNVWLGVSVEDQRRADERIPDLLDTPAAVRFLSVEPLLGPVNLDRVKIDETAWMSVLTGLRYWGPTAALIGSKLDWVIVGGESGPGARPMHPKWADDIRIDCAQAGVPYFFKQWGEWAPVDTDVDIDRDTMLWPDGTTEGGTHTQHGGVGAWMRRVGKKQAGRLLNGVEHNARPEAAR